VKIFWGWFLIFLGVVEILVVVRYTWKSTKEAKARERIIAVLTAITDPVGIMLGLLIILLGILTIIIRYAIKIRVNLCFQIFFVIK
jgi:uncharacterized membrane protein SirB2